jgi:hypothetical protein
MQEQQNTRVGQYGAWTAVYDSITVVFGLETVTVCGTPCYGSITVKYDTEYGVRLRSIVNGSHPITVYVPYLRHITGMSKIQYQSIIQ